MDKRALMLECLCCGERFIAIPEEDLQNTDPRTKVIRFSGTEKIEFFYCDKCVANDYTKK